MGAENLAKVLKPEEVAALPVFQAWQRTTHNEPPDIYPRVELFNGWDFFGSPEIRKNVFGTAPADPTQAQWRNYIALVWGHKHQIQAADGRARLCWHSPGWVPLFLALSQIDHATVQDFIRRCLLPYELAYGVSLYSSFFLTRGSLHEYTRFLHIA